MQFSDTTNKNGIIQQIEQTSKLGDGAISGNTQLLIEFTNRINNWVYKVTHWLHKVDGERPYDDANYTDFPIEVYNIVDDQFDYEIATEGEENSLIVKKVELRDAVSLEYYNVDYFDEIDRPDNEFGGDAGKPSKYYMNGSSVIFDIKPDIALVDKFRVTYDRNGSTFTTADTTKTPGFDKTYHPILVFGPTLEWALPLGKTEVITLCRSMLYGTDNEVDIGLKRMAEEHYSQRLPQKIPKIARKSTNRI